MSEKITITIDTDNAAFEDQPPEYEAARILRDLADNLEFGDLMTYTLRPLRDISGNAVGFCRVSSGGAAA